MAISMLTKVGSQRTEVLMRRSHLLSVVVLVLAFAASGVLAASKKNKAPSTGTDGSFTDSLPAAADQARADKRVILLDFTGSDWCGFCIKLKEQVFDTKDFKTWA